MIIYATYSRSCDVLEDFILDLGLCSVDIIVWNLSSGKWGFAIPTSK